MHLDKFDGPEILQINRGRSQNLARCSTCSYFQEQDKSKIQYETSDKIDASF